jgi:signal peptidase II
VQARGGAPVSRLRLAALTAAVVGLDQLTKALVVGWLAEGESVRLIDDVLRLSHVRNSGAAFGLLRGFGGVLALAALAGAIGFIGVLVRKPPMLMGIAAALVAAGAIGNLIDRLTRGTVVDFVDFRYWPSFNVADSAISIGAILLLLSSWREKPRER